jgi:hypothetical protein
VFEITGCGGMNRGERLTEQVAATRSPIVV